MLTFYALPPLDVFFFYLIFWFATSLLLRHINIPVTEICIARLSLDHSSVPDSSPVVVREPFQQQIQPLLPFQYTTNIDTEIRIPGAIPDGPSVPDNGPIVVQKPFVSCSSNRYSPYPQQNQSRYSCTTDRLARRSCLLSTHFLCSISSSSRDLQPRRLLLQQATCSKLRIISHDRFSIALRSGHQSGGVPAVQQPFQQPFQDPVQQQYGSHYMRHYNNSTFHEV